MFHLPMDTRDKSPTSLQTEQEDRAADEARVPPAYGAGGIRGSGARLGVESTESEWEKSLSHLPTPGG